MNALFVNLILSIVLTLSGDVFAEDELELETTFIKGNKELPQVIYIVPWQNVKVSHRKEEILVLHSLYGDAFEPVTPKKLGFPTNLGAGNAR